MSLDWHPSKTEQEEDYQICATLFQTACRKSIAMLHCFMDFGYLWQVFFMDVIGLLKHMYAVFWEHLEFFFIYQCKYVDTNIFGHQNFHLTFYFSNVLSSFSTYLNWDTLVTNVKLTPWSVQAKILYGSIGTVLTQQIYLWDLHLYFSWQHN